MRHPKPSSTPKAERELAHAVATWLDAEQAAGDVEGVMALSPTEAEPDAVAEQTLHDVFANWPSLTPSTGFVDAVLARAGVSSHHAVRDLGTRLKVLVAAALVLTALAFGVLVPAVWSLIHAVGPGTAVATVAQEMVTMLAGVIHTAVDLVSMSYGLSALPRALWLLVSSPQGASFVLVLTAFTLGLSRWLVALVANPRSLRHVPSA